MNKTTTEPKIAPTRERAEVGPTMQGSEILVAHSADDVMRVLARTSEAERKAIGERARRRVLGAHTAAHRADELERYVLEVTER